MRGRQTLLGILTGVLMLSMAACGSSEDDGPSAAAADSTELSEADIDALGGADALAELQELYKAALDADQSKVTVYGPGETDKVPVYELFAERFPGLEVEGTFLVGPEYFAKLEGEFASGQHVADLVQTGDTGVTPDVAAKYFDTYVPKSSEGLPEEFIGPDGVVRAASAAAFGYMYNTNLMTEDEAPKGWADLTDPAYKGKMTLEDPRRFSGAFSAFSHLLWDGRYDASYLEDLAPQEMVYQASGPVAGTAVATGQKALNPSYTLALWQKDKAAGAPVEFVFPTEGGAHLSPNYLALVKDAPSPEAAKLLMAWLFTPEAQQATADVGWYPLMPGSKGPAGFPSTEEISLLKPFPLDEVAQISEDNLVTIQGALGKE